MADSTDGQQRGFVFSKMPSRIPDPHQDPISPQFQIKLKAKWRNKIDLSLYAEQSYFGIDRVIIVDESRDRLVLNVLKMSDFDFTDWEKVI